MNIKIVVAVHKKYWVPSDDMYFPLFVGKAISKEQLDYAGDDVGDNISEKNDKYSELTGLYWAWKNLDADYIGLVHYRRYLADPTLPRGMYGDEPSKQILTRDTAEKILCLADAIVSRRRKYFIETIYSHYDHTHDGEHLRLAGEIIDRQCPEYAGAFKKVLEQTSAHMFNMFVMRRELYCDYCAWLFSILEELDQLVDDTHMTPFERRYMGRIGELLLDVWLEQNHVSYKEVPYVQLGEINWLRKARAFLAAKFRHRKYEQSI